MAGYRNVPALLADHAERRDAIRLRLEEFAAIPPDRIFGELVYCLLTPQSSAINAEAAVDELERTGILERGEDPTPVLRRKDAYIRFHRTKALRLLEARRGREEIVRRLAARGEPETVRAWLVDNVKGLGWKEASHVLRNIGYRNLAILDRHILKNLRAHGVIGRRPVTLTPARYKAIESRFRAFAIRIGVDMDELDLLFWSRETGEIRK